MLRWFPFAAAVLIFIIISANDYRFQVDQLKEEIKGLQGELTDAKATIAGFASTNANLNEKLRKKQAIITGYHFEVDQLKEEVKGLQGKVTSAKEVIAVLAQQSKYIIRLSTDTIENLKEKLDICEKASSTKSGWVERSVEILIFLGKITVDYYFK